MTGGHQDARMAHLLDELQQRFALELSGLAVFTEAASGAYMPAPILAARAGARRVYAVTRDSRYASAESVIDDTRAAAERWDVGNVVEVAATRPSEWIADADVFTNSGFVRPIDRVMVERMKPTAVVSLMWETWEFREADLDLDACREQGILVLGTNEARPPCDMTGYSAFLGIKVLFELGLEGYGSRTLLLGGQDTLAVAMERGLVALGVPVTRFGAAGGRAYEELEHHFSEHGAEYDALLVAEHADPRLLLGPGGVLEPDAIRRINPALAVGVIAGAVDGEALRASGLHHFPEDVRPFGHMSYQAYALGPRPVLELFAAGLAVGQAMARSRLAGASPRDAARHALDVAPAMDFPGERGWA
jgi:hypothetical protein